MGVTMGKVPRGRQPHQPEDVARLSAEDTERADMLEVMGSARVVESPVGVRRTKGSAARELLERNQGRDGTWNLGHWNAAQWDGPAPGSVMRILVDVFEAPTKAARSVALDRLANHPAFVSTFVRDPEARRAVVRLSRRPEWLRIKRRVLRFAVRLAVAATQERVGRLDGVRVIVRPDVPHAPGPRLHWLRRRARAEVSGLLEAWDLNAEMLASLLAEPTRRPRERDLTMLTTLGARYGREAPALLDIAEKTLRNRGWPGAIRKGRIGR
jgi:hypothetical protein